MSELFPSLFQTDENGLIVAVVLCAWAVFIVKGALPHPLFAAVLFPGFIFATLLFDALLRDYGLQPTSDKMVNLAFAAGTGVISAFGVFAALCWAVSLRGR
jgi:hypothetical protein